MATSSAQGASNTRKEYGLIRLNVNELEAWILVSDRLTQRHHLDKWLADVKDAQHPGGGDGPIAYSTTKRMLRLDVKQLRTLNFFRASHGLPQHRQRPKDTPEEEAAWQAAMWAAYHYRMEKEQQAREAAE